MALSERAELVARLSLKDDFSRRVSGVQKNFASSMGKIQKTAIQGARNTATNLGRVGAVAGGFIALNVKSGISSLAELEDAVTSVDGAIKQVGKGWTTTGQQIAAIANQIETDVQRAFDDKEITQAAATLIRYGNISEDQLEPALRIMTDLAAKTGDVGSASEALAKALADPTKATRLLRQAGVALTKEQTAQIKKWVESGDLLKAQTFLLGEVEKKTKGAAAAMHGPYADSIRILQDVTEDAQRALGEAFLPVISKVADKLSNELAKPETIKNLRAFGQTLAGAFDKVLEVGGRIPWQQIGDSLKLAGTGAKAIFDAFTSLPPWVQTAVLTGWGLNKLTGGALGTIVGELGKGLIKGVLGMNAGVVNINAARVNGGVPGAATSGGGGIKNAVGAGAAAAVVVQGVLDVGTVAQGVQQGYEAGQRGDIQGVLDAQRGIFDNVMLLPPGIRELGQIITAEQQKVINQQRAAADKITTRVENMKGGMVQATQRAADRSVNSAERTRAGIAQAIRNNRTVVNVRVNTNVTVAGVARAWHTTRTYGAGMTGAAKGM